MATMPGTRIITAPGWTGRPRSVVGLIDCDVHQVITAPEDLHPYLPRIYKEQLIEQGGLRIPSSGYFNIPQNAARTDLAANCDANKHDPFHDGGAYETLRDEHLDVWDVDYALLTGASTYGASIVPDPDYAAALCGAFNDWTLEHWIARDERVIMAMSISTIDP